MRLNSFHKIVFITSFITVALLIELFSKYTINNAWDCHTSFFKIEFLPMVLIGFLFGLKYSLFANLLYLFIHYLMESGIYLHSGIFENLDFNLHVILFLFYFFFPFISCVLSGFFYIKNLKDLNQKTILKIIISACLLIIIFNIVTLMLFYKFFLNQLLEKLHIHQIPNIFNNLTLSPQKIYLFYMISSIIVNYLIIGTIIYFLMPRLKDYFVRN